MLSDHSWQSGGDYITGELSCKHKTQDPRCDHPTILNNVK